MTTEIPFNIGYTDGRQRQWVADALARASADPSVDFVVVLMHQAAFSSSSKHGSDLGVQAAWFDLFAEHSVDLVLQGHDHTYERTHGMRGTTVVDRDGPYRTDTGTVYVVVGNGGEVQEPFKPLQPEWSANRVAGRIGTLRVDVDPFAPRGMRRLVLGEFAAADGRPVEHGIVLERPAGSRRRAPAGAAQVSPVPGVAQLPGLGATAVAAGAATTSLTAGRLREPDDLSGDLLT